MKKNIIASAILLLIILMAIGCNKESDKKEVRKSKITADYYGDELYNASFVDLGDTIVYHNIAIMSKKDLTKVEKYSVDFLGGEASFDIDVVEKDYKLDGYSLYIVSVEISDIKYEEEKIDISSVKLYLSDDEFIDLKPDKCEIVNTENFGSGIDVYFQSSPLSLPPEMRYIPVELLASKDGIKLNNIFLTNSDMKVSFYNGSEKFTPINFSKKEELKNVTINFEIDDTEIGKYKQFATSIIAEYEEDGKKYYAYPGVTTTYYNKTIDFNNIEEYYYK